MATTLQPVPSYALPFLGNEEEMARLGLKFNPLWLKWFLDLIKDLQTGGAVEHNTLSGLQGGVAGSPGEYYHLRTPVSQTGKIARSDGTDWLATTTTYPNVAAQGDVIYAATTNALSGLSIGSAGKFLQSDGTVPVWSTSAFPATATRGDLIRASAANTWTVLAVGSAGKWLRTDGTDPSWSTATLANTWTAGDITYASSANVLGALSVGASGKLVQSNGTLPVYTSFTLPTAISSTGTILRSDGINYTASAATYPGTFTGGDVLYASGANVVAGLAVGASAGQMLRSTGSLPAWSTTTWPNTATSGGVLYASGANAWATSGALGSTQVVLGGGAGAAPNTSANLAFDGNILTLGPSASAVGELLVRSNQGSTGTAFFGLFNSVITNTDNKGLFGKIVYGTSVPDTTAKGMLFIGLSDSTANPAFGLFGRVGTDNSTDAAVISIDGRNRPAGGTNWDSGGGSALTARNIAQFANAGTAKSVVGPLGQVGVGVTAPTAMLHIAAGSASASTAPLKFTTGTSMTSAEAGAVEYTTDDLFFTIATGTARKRLLMADATAGLTSGRLPFATTNGRLTDSANATLDSSGNAVFAGTVSGTNSIFASMTSQTSAIRLGQVSDSTGYGQISFNGVYTAAGHLGLFGGASGDTLNLYRNVPTGGKHEWRVNSTAAASLTATNFVLPATVTLNAGTHSALGAETLSGYITIKDAGGTTRKLGVIS